MRHALRYKTARGPDSANDWLAQAVNEPVFPAVRTLGEKKALHLELLQIP